MIDQPSPPPITSPAIEAAKASCVQALPAIEHATPGDGASVKVPYQGHYVRVKCYHNAQGELVVRVTKPRRVRHYHIVIDESRP